MHLEFERRVRGALLIGLATALLLPSIAAFGDPVPVITTYELSKARKDRNALARDPKGFWVGEIVARIEDRKPALRVPLKTPVTVQMSFVVKHDGTLLSKEIVKSSGIPAIDKSAIAMLDKAAPFPPMPDALSDSQLAFTLPLRFR